METGSRNISEEQMCSSQFGGGSPAGFPLTAEFREVLGTPGGLVTMGYRNYKL
jgi:hypothetical protein